MTDGVDALKHTHTSTSGREDDCNVSLSHCFKALMVSVYFMLLDLGANKSCTPADRQSPSTVHAII